MNNESEELKKRISLLSDDELLKLINVDFADYNEQAVSLAKKELSNRGVKNIKVEKKACNANTTVTSIDYSDGGVTEKVDNKQDRMQIQIDFLVQKIKRIITDDKKKIYYKDIINLIETDYKDITDEEEKLIKYAIFSNKEIQELTGITSISLKHLAIKWFIFYVAILPINILFGIFILIANFSISPVLSFLGMLETAFCVILYFGLRKLRYWAWCLNFVRFYIWYLTLVVLITLAIIGVNIANENIFLEYIIFCLVYVTPNWIYFKNREYMFADVPYIHK